MIKEKIEQYVPGGAKVELIDNAAVFEVSALDINKIANDLYHTKKLALKLITATDERADNGCFKIWYIFGVPKENLFIIPYLELRDKTEFPSLTSTIHEALNFERKIYTFFGLKPTNCHGLSQIILHENWPMDKFPLRKDFNWQTQPAMAKGEYKFQEVSGEGIYEIPVGPIHAGIIEPGHFRFSVAGESIVLLEPRLGYTHKGSEKLFEVLSPADKLRLAEKISGDSSFSHSLAYCQALEKLSNIDVPKRAQYLRVIYAELERLANHFGDIGAIMTDAGYNFGGAQGARLREMVMQTNERAAANRFLRGVNVMGGVTKDLDENQEKELVSMLDNLLIDFSEVIKIAENSTTLLNRLKGTGVLSKEVALEYGVLGVAGRAVGLANDARLDYSYAAYGELNFKETASQDSGDVYARFKIRISEVASSIKLIQEAVKNLPTGPISLIVSDSAMKKNSLAVGLVEGWRGDIIYFVTTDAKGEIARVSLRDPSFVNWSALGEVGVDNVVPDFPLINKSFNLSYSGNDL